MDPVTALGVAAAVVQFIDYGTELVLKGREIYKSGELGNNVELKEATSRLKNLVEPLRSSVQLGVQGQHPSSPTNADQALEEICSNCINLSEELRNLLDSLKLDPDARHPKLASFRRAVKIVWSEEKIQGLKGQLDDLRSNLETHVLVDLRYRMIQIKLEQDNHFMTLDQTLQAMMKDILDKHDNTSSILEQGFNNLKLTQEKEQSNARTVLLDQHKRQTELSILETLKFSSMNLRYETIAEAHQQTFEWIFCDPEVERKPWSYFSEWLRRENGIYWIHGKPGSGKSTLMRFIVQDPRSRDYAKTWAQDVALETPSFFFWNSGDVAQRSQSGLLRTLLYKILEEHCDLIPVVFPREWKTVLENARHGIPTKATDWSLRVLKESFRTLINETSGKLSFCFFIDGLDEYEGDYWEIAEYFCELSNSKHAKFCLSSRPEIEFLDTFGRMPQLRLQDLTASDIAIYVRDKLESNPRMQSLIETSPRESSTLIEAVVNAGGGVFLWIRLVVNSLLNGLRKRDKISTLMARLREIPKELDDFYGRILSSIDQIHMMEASKIFQLEKVASMIEADPGTAMYRCDDRYLPFYVAIILSPKTFKHAIFDDETSYFQEQTPEDYMKILSDLLRMRCGGLLETSGTKNGYNNVQYIHRTARDYIQKSAIWETLLTYTSGLEFDPWFIWSVVYLQWLKGYRTQGSFCWRQELCLEIFWESFTISTRNITSTGAKIHILALVEEFDRVAQWHLESIMPSGDLLERWHCRDDYMWAIKCHSPVGYKMSQWSDTYCLWLGSCHRTIDLLSACIERHVYHYAEMKILSNPSVMQVKYNPPLAALTFLAYPLELHRGCKLLVFLLEHNASLNEMYHGHTLWKIWLHIIHTEYSGGLKDPHDFFLVMEIMLRRGADLQVCCFAERMIWEKIYHHDTRNGYGPPNLPVHVLWSREYASDSDESDYAMYTAKTGENRKKRWEVRHSLEYIIKDSFEKHRPDLSVKLLDLIAEKRAEKSVAEMQTQIPASGSSGGKKGRKQKQRNRNKGKGVRGKILQVEHDSV